MPHELASRYDSKSVESKWYPLWESSGYFTPKIDPAVRPFTIVIPPPNVTGILHMGHALNNTIQDILIRWQRMRGIPTLWVPGVDHAGIATQNVVEKKLAKEGKNRHQIGREKFVEEVWRWKEEHGATIVRQLKRLGASCDWKRERFTMDEGLSRAVREAFVSLYEKGLIYRGDYIINWCPRCQTALSDEEAVHQETKGALYHIQYPVEGSSERVTVATTRPETMLGDTAVAVHPKDSRYRHLKGKKVVLPLVNRSIPVIEDDFVDPEFGTGVVKVTPAHDPNDFQMGMRHSLTFLNVMNPDGTMNESAGPYQGLDRSEARKRVLNDLEREGFLVKKEDHVHAVGHCYRCRTVVEPRLSKQWFVKMKPLAERAVKAARDGKVKFVPDRWTKVYLNWLENIRDWCISRQIWWGHQIPVWYCKKCCHPERSEGSRSRDASTASQHDKVIVSRTTPTKCPACGSSDLEQDPDVLDTWFSSWLWPFSTLGWPDHTKDLAYFYPTSTLVTAPEILFFWVARMIMAGLQFMGEAPFHTVVIHGTVRVEGGQKMSKSLGNSIDPIEIIDEMGADALRFSVMMLAATDVYLSREKLEMGRNFTNKIWNAARFVLGNLDGDGPRVSFVRDPSNLSVVDKWILFELDQTIRDTTRALTDERFFDAANTLYHFFWHSFCDWYLELVKPALQGQEMRSRKDAVCTVLVSVLEMSMRLLHPFMPFVTEEIWQQLKAYVPEESSNVKTIMLAKWPETFHGDQFDTEADQVRLFQEAVGGIRDLRARLGLKPSEPVSQVLIKANKKSQAALTKFKDQISHMGRVGTLTIAPEVKKETGMVGRVYAHMEIFVGGLSEESLREEGERTRKKIQEVEGVLRALEDRLADETFTAKAPQEVVEKERERREELKQKLTAHRENLEMFG